MTDSPSFGTHVSQANKLLDPAVNDYIHNLAKRTDNSTLRKMEAHAHEENFPIVGRLAGIFLKTLAQMIQANRIFEFGSGYGYSAYWFCKGTQTDGQIICTDSNPLNKEKAQKYLSADNMWKQIIFHIGHAQDIFAQTTGEFDICYNDANKNGYPDIWQMAKERIRPGGLYIADNALWQGRVARHDRTDPHPDRTAAIKAHNQLIFSDSEFDAFINPVRDGIIVARRKMA